MRNTRNVSGAVPTKHCSAPCVRTKHVNGSGNWQGSSRKTGDYREALAMADWTLRFAASSKPATAFDDMGETAMMSLDGVIAQFAEPELSKLWETIKAEA